MSPCQRYFWNLLIGVDQLANALLGGDPDETISSRISKLAHRYWWARVIARVLNWIDPGHTDKAREDDEGGDAAFKIKGESS